MTELNDNREVTMYSSGVLYILSAVTPPREYVEDIAEQFIIAIRESSVRKPPSLAMGSLTLGYFRSLTRLSSTVYLC